MIFRDDMIVTVLKHHAKFDIHIRRAMRERMKHQADEQIKPIRKSAGTLVDTRIIMRPTERMPLDKQLKVTPLLMKNKNRVVPKSH